jgi:signal transduction histidine kinase/ligand-binding sensor domain-containing protein
MCLFCMQKPKCKAVFWLRASFLLLAFMAPFWVSAQFHQFIFRNYSVRDGLSQNTVACIGQDKMGFMWFGTFNGLNRFDGFDFVHYKNQPGNANSLANSRCRYIVTDSLGDLWVETVEGIFNRYNLETDDFTRFQPNEAPKQVRDLFEKQTQPEVFSYKHHHFKFHDEQERVFTYTNSQTGESTRQVVNFNNPNGILDTYLVSIFVDNNHCLWVGGFSTGLYKADLERKAFGLFLFGTEEPNAEAMNNIRSVWQDTNGDLWLGTRDFGLIWLDDSFRKKRHFYYKPANGEKAVHSDENDIRRVFRDSKNRLWVCSKGGISYFREDKQEFTNVFRGARWDSRYFCYNITEDSEARIWFATFSGLGQWDSINEKVVLYNEANGVEVHPTLRFVQIDRHGHLWVGSEVGGLTRLVQTGSTAEGLVVFKSTRFFATDSVENPLSDNRLYSSCIDETGDVWFGTGAGLNRFNESTGQFDVVGIAHGLSNDMIMGVLSDGKGHVWVSHKRGISKVNIKTLSVTNFSAADGLQSDEFNEDAYFKNPDTGEMFFGGARGVNRFFPEQIQPNQVPPVVIVSVLNVDGQKINIGDKLGKQVVLTQNVVLAKQVVLPYHVKSFSLTFAAIAFSSPENIAFQYKLEGFDKDWVKADSDIRRASYTNIPPGDYVFWVKAMNNDGVWSEQPLQLRITIHPPFWHTWWFRAAVALLFVLGLVMFFYIRLYSLRRKNILLEQKVAERTRAVELRNSQISEQMAQIMEQNKTINNKNEEITAQAEQLDQQKSHLQEAYDELDGYRNRLEKLVDERTRDLRREKERAEESDKLKTSFLSNLSHEIRTPLNAIVGFTSFVFDNAFDEQEKQGFKLLVDSNCQSLIDLIEEMIDYARIDADQVHLNLQPVAIADLMQRFQQVYELQLKMHQSIVVAEKSIAFNLKNDLPESFIQLQLDEKRLSQVMSYLISNAIKFTSAGSIEVGCRLNKDCSGILFYVKDTGIGISKENQQVIFDSFRKIETPETNVYRGVGLGLSIALRLVQLMGGGMCLESTFGKGSTFYVELPLSNTSPVADNCGCKVPDLKGFTVLVAEDDMVNSMFLRGLLAKTGAEVVCAENGLQVIRLCEQNPSVSLVLMDVKMPVLDGNQALQQLRAKGFSMPVIAQTAYAFQFDKEHFNHKAFDALLIKPVVPEQLFRLLNEFLVGSRSCE